MQILFNLTTHPTFTKARLVQDLCITKCRAKRIEHGWQEKTTRQHEFCQVTVFPYSRQNQWPLPRKAFLAGHGR